MKKSLVILAATAATLFLASCGHNVGVVGIGTGFRAGGPEYGINYGEGMFGTFVTRDGVRFKAEIDSTTGFSYDPTTNSYKGIRSVEYSLPPQINGYAVDFAKENPEVAKAYYDAMLKFYEAQAEDGKTQKPLVSEEKSKSSTSMVAEVLKEAIKKAKSIVNGKEESEGKDAVFECDGNCDYPDLTGNADIGYQLSIAMKLLEYDGDTHHFEDTDERYKATLEHFVSEVIFYKARGHKNTPLRVKSVKVEDGVITSLMYAYITRDGEKRDVTCPSCCFLDDEDAD